jgi:hypothetical protein
MGIFIEDGKGSGNQAGVTDNRQDTSSRMAPRMYYVSRDAGNAFASFSGVATADTGSYIAYLKNTHSSKNIIVDELIVTTQLANKFKVWQVTGTAAAQDTGSTKTPKNLRTSSGNPAQATFMGDTGITGLTVQGNAIACLRVPAFGEEDLSLNDGLQIGPGDAIAVEVDGNAAGEAEVTILYFFDGESIL